MDGIIGLAVNQIGMNADEDRSIKEITPAEAKTFLFYSARI